MTFSTKSSNQNFIVFLKWFCDISSNYKSTHLCQKIPILRFKTGESHPPQLIKIFTFEILTSIKFKQPSLGTKAVIFLPLFISWTLTLFLKQNLAVWPLLFPAQFPLHGKYCPKGWPQGCAQMGFFVLFIIPLLVISDYRASW
jgi:hypothetical protein